MQLGAWGRFLAPRDSRGRESRTLFFVAVTVGLLWAAVGLLLWGFWAGRPPMAATEFAAALATLCGALVALLGAWLGREWIADRRAEREPPHA